MLPLVDYAYDPSPWGHCEENCCGPDNSLGYRVSLYLSPPSFLPSETLFEKNKQRQRAAHQVKQLLCPLEPEFELHIPQWRENQLPKLSSDPTHV